MTNSTIKKVVCKSIIAFIFALLFICAFSNFLPQPSNKTELKVEAHNYSTESLLKNSNESILTTINRLNSLYGALSAILLIMFNCAVKDAYNEIKRVISQLSDN